MTKELMIEAIYEKIAERINIYGLDGQSLVTWDLAPVMIGDLLDYMEVISKGEDGEYTKQGGQWIAENGGLVIFKWKEKRKPIEEQSEDTIKYIYDLIKGLCK